MALGTLREIHLGLLRVEIETIPTASWAGHPVIEGQTKLVGKLVGAASADAYRMVVRVHVRQVFAQTLDQ